MEEVKTDFEDRSTKKIRLEDGDAVTVAVSNDNNEDKIDKIDTTTTTDKSEDSTVTATDDSLKPKDCVATESKKVNLVVFGLPKFMDNTKFQKLLKKNDTIVVKAKKIYRETFAIVTLENAELAQSFTEKYNNMEVEGSTLEVREKQSQAERGKGANDNNNSKKRDRNGNNTNNNNNNNNNNNSGGSGLKLIEDITNPWHKLEYSVQLEKKEANVTNVLRDMTSSIRKECTSQPQWLQALKGRVVACPLEEIVPSPETSHYRNKTSYTIGRLEDGNPCVGFALGRTGNGVTVVGDPTPCLIISERSNAIRLHLQEYIRAHPRPPFDKTTHTGFWRQLNVRDFTTGQTMATVQFNHRGLSEEEITGECNQLIELFARAKGTKAEVTSLSVQLYDGVSNAAPVDLPVKIIDGPETIVEKLLGKEFHVSSNAFFQVNSKAAESLFSKVTEWAGVNERSIVLDVCCGTGTIGQCISDKARHVYGLEMAPDAVADARVNAERNGIKNIDYIVGKAEDTTDKLLQMIHQNYRDAKDGEIIGIVDPPRAGLHQNVIKSLRTLETMKKLVYVSCNQNSLIVDAARLCKSITNTMKGTPFRPVKAIAVDLFPHTEHCEVVVLFERINMADTTTKSTSSTTSTTTTKEEPITNTESTTKIETTTPSNDNPILPEKEE
ncbi:hypothetical protein PPL_05876 [Heterostelium album PN500]|uniref:Uncharacterized protein n=1 Tax=Heterostelium pallidum (strain ATCC 26659 / Pp 5 / PN500) TaxID=670386 RepID=D3BBK8_HETP5|nr:hypothetical protein PPL_05876 [Heterostelium album PN500]EFA81041.1 hypothetical protein PPL_05876 [Heterostelium album PN500]|eukprot:XP_020433159.1 hypothetical protein PPL_05876 [Heterostelium album PN500]